MRWLLLPPLAALLVLFVLSNPAEVELGLWPFDVALAAPLWLAVVGPAACAFLLGAVLVWTAGRLERRRGQDLARAARLLEAELATLRAREAEETRARHLGRAA